MVALQTHRTRIPLYDAVAKTDDARRSTSPSLQSHILRLSRRPGEAIELLHSLDPQIKTQAID